MFKEIQDTITELLQPIVDVPSFVADKDKPIDLITLISANFNTSRDIDKYVKIVISKDRDFIYVLYNNLETEKGSLILYDNLVYKGNVCQITLVDYEAVMVDREPERPLAALILLSICAVTFKKAKCSSFMYTSTKKLSFLFEHAAVFVYLSIALSVFDDTEDLRDGLLTIMQSVKIYQFNCVDKDILDAYIKLIKENGISLLLDCSLIASVIEEEKDDNDEKASV